jgi:hypothetical protein
MAVKTASEKFEEFLKSQDTIRDYQGEKLLFSSQAEGLLPLMGYAAKFAPNKKDVTVFDRGVGNAAALLLKKALCKEVYSQLDSESAIQAPESFGIKNHFNEVMPCIQDDSRQNLCPMEKMSLGKTAEEFYS